MIDLYSWATSNGRKASIMLEETGLEYEVHPVDLSKRDQRQPEYLALNPNGRIPTIVDREGPGGKPITIFLIGALMVTQLASIIGTMMLAPSRMKSSFPINQYPKVRHGSLPRIRNLSPNSIPR